MNDKNSLDGLLNEMVASMSHDSRNAMMRRINAERLIKLIAENLVENHTAEKIRVIPDNRLTSQDAADYLIQVDDYDMRLILVDGSDGKVNITENLLEEWITLLESNPSTNILLAVWTNDELSAISFTMKGLKSAIESRDQIKKLENSVKPFVEVISDQIKRQTKGWKIPKLDPNKPSTAHRDLYSIFSHKIINAIDIEAGRHYRNEERVRAASIFPAEREKRVILDILRNALDGAPGNDLEKRLTSLPRRGEK